jgi:hypothetical protein
MSRLGVRVRDVGLGAFGDEGLGTEFRFQLQSICPALPGREKIINCSMKTGKVEGSWMREVEKKMHTSKGS